MAWRGELKFKDLLADEDVSDEVATALGQEAASRLYACALFTSVRPQLVEAFRAVTNQDSFNVAMDRLYDAADHQRIWIA